MSLLASEYHEADFDFTEHAKEAAAVVAQQQAGAAAGAEARTYDHTAWETFYRQHTQARFFKERRYPL